MSKNLIEELKIRVRENKKNIVLPESEDERVIRAAAKVIEQDFANIILVGDECKINEDAKKYGVDISEPIGRRFEYDI